MSSHASASTHACTPAHINIHENNKYQMHSASIWVLPTLRSNAVGPHTHACLQPNSEETGLEQGTLEKDPQLEQRVPALGHNHANSVTPASSVRPAGSKRASRNSPAPNPQGFLLFCLLVLQRDFIMGWEVTQAKRKCYRGFDMVCLGNTSWLWHSHHWPVIRSPKNVPSCPSSFFGQSPELKWTFPWPPTAALPVNQRLASGSLWSLRRGLQSQGWVSGLFWLS